MKIDINRLECVINEIREACDRDNKYIDLKDKISKIKSAFYTNWEQEHLPFINEFIDKTKLGIPIPVLSICGKGTQEVRFTKYLSYFLDCKKYHGLGNKLLKSILRDEMESLDIKEEFYNEYVVEPEIWLGSFLSKDKEINCYCDIGIISKDYSIFIEQKILSSESTNKNTELKQLERYTLAINNNPRFKNTKQLKIYLTPEGNLPEDVDDWVPLSHKDIINRGIALLYDVSLSKIAKDNLKRFLLDLTIGLYEKCEGIISEMIDLAEELSKEGFNLNKVLKFNKLVEENSMLVKLIMEVL